MVRVTLRDGEQMISFLSEVKTAQRLVAACASRPGSIGELLVAAEVFERGIAARLMAELMKFDKEFHRGGASFARTAAKEGMAFQVVDEATEAEAQAPREGELLLIDVAAQRIEHSPGLAAPREGEVVAREETGETGRRITYVLPNEWEVGGVVR